MLKPSDFATFVREVHGYCPFPWQETLVDHVIETGQWPDAVDVPTGLGKTSTLDAAVFLAAFRGERFSRRRIFFVVDRRLVVDEAFDHARAIKQALDNPAPGSVSEEVASALSVSGANTVLEVVRMRGGVTWDARWVERPDQYAIVTGTVDQVGSRILFRGYGVTEQARSIDAALVGTDSLLLVDEAHLARPLVATLDRLAELDPGGGMKRPRMVTMSATAPRSYAVRLGIGEADLEHRVAAARLRAAKRLHTVEVRASRAAAHATMTDALVRLATVYARSGMTVGVVANTVIRARAVYDRVAQSGVDAVLLTGRSRLVDRDYLLREHYGRLQVGRSRLGAPLVLVATQTIEVGANVDLDALVTESAPLDALVQRLGRLNRLGEITERSAPALVVHDVSLGDKDPVYGPFTEATWRWLTEQCEAVRYTPRLDPTGMSGGVDASPLALRDLTSGAPAGLVPEPAYVPVLTPQALDAWVRTSPTPLPDPPVAPYLHGLTDARAGVRVVWRYGLPEDDLGSWAERVTAIPPTADEEIEVSRGAAVRWLEGAGTDPSMGDLDSTAEAEDPETAPEKQPRRVRDEQGRPLVLRVSGRNAAEPLPASRIVPGDLIVVPVWYGGCDRFGWNPPSSAEVVDVADLALRRCRPVVRLGPYLRKVVNAYHPELAESPFLAQLLDQVERDAEEGELDAAEYRRLIRKLVGSATEEHDDQLPPLLHNLQLLQERGRAFPAEAPWHAVLARRGAAMWDDRSTTGSSAIGRRITLRSHQDEVGEMACKIATALALDGPVVNSIVLASRWHDEGKRDPRFQAMLWGGDLRRAEIATEPIAKSGMDPADRQAHRQASERAGYPSGLRHEALSAQVAAARARDRDDVDAELVTHLVTSHHGYGRPLLPAVVDPAPQAVTVDGQTFSTGQTVDWEAPARFTRLNQRYGRWGLALLESVVRLADMWCSARESGEEVQ